MKTKILVTICCFIFLFGTTGCGLLFVALMNHSTDQRCGKIEQEAYQSGMSGYQVHRKLMQSSCSTYIENGHAYAGRN